MEVDCAAIPETLIESELFGTSAARSPALQPMKKGRFTLADGGSIFLDEIGISASRCRPSRCACSRSASSSRSAASARRKVDAGDRRHQRDLRQLVAEGQVPGDLYYRLQVIPIELRRCVPALDRPSALVDHFVQKFSQRLGKCISGVDAQAMAELKRYHWPGNVRELENTIERAVVLTTGPSLTPRGGLGRGHGPAPTTGLPSSGSTRTWSGSSAETIRHALDAPSRRQEGRRRGLAGPPPAGAVALPGERSISSARLRAL
ncbi:MAG: sigma 54-interacting transcriptional regulator [Vicinamibacterales bacterium]